jgi:lysozyme
MIKASPKALALNLEFEGVCLKAYADPLSGGDPWTIGIGATGPGIRKGVVWTLDQVHQRHRDDVAKRDVDLNRLLNGAATTQDQYDALMCFGFNVGFYDVRRGGRVVKVKLEGSTLLRLHKVGDYAGAAREFGKWINKGSSVERGLTRRRAAEAALYQGKR